MLKESPLGLAMERGLLPADWTERRTLGVDCGHFFSRKQPGSARDVLGLCSRCCGSNVRIAGNPFAATIDTALIERLCAFGVPRMMACELMLSDALARCPVEPGRRPWVPQRFVWASQRYWDRNAYPKAFDPRSKTVSIRDPRWTQRLEWGERLASAVGEAQKLGVRVVRTTNKDCVLSLEPPDAPKVWTTDVEAFGIKIRKS